MVDAAANVQMFLAVAVLGLSLVLGFVGAISYRRLRHPRLLLIALGFGAFAAKGAYLVRSTVTSHGQESWVSVVAAWDLVILLLLYLAIRTR